MACRPNGAEDHVIGESERVKEIYGIFDEVVRRSETIPAYSIDAGVTVGDLVFFALECVNTTICWFTTVDTNGKPYPMDSSFVPRLLAKVKDVDRDTGLITSTTELWSDTQEECYRMWCQTVPQNPMKHVLPVLDGEM